MRAEVHNNGVKVYGNKPPRLMPSVNAGFPTVHGLAFLGVPLRAVRRVKSSTSRHHAIITELRFMHRVHEEHTKDM